MISVSMVGKTSYNEYVRKIALNNELNHDLVIIYYDYNDVKDGFEAYY